MNNLQQRVPGAGLEPPPAPWRRTCLRVPITAHVMLRRSGQLNYRVSIHDISPLGCKLEFIDRPRLDETVWVKFEGFGPVQAQVCWTGHFAAGVKFAQPLHQAVFDLILQRVTPGGR